MQGEANLWNIIRDFIVQYITGGYTSEGDTYYACLGMNGNTGHETFIQYNVGINVDDTTAPAALTLSDWLARTITIIAMCLIVAFAIWLVRWVFKAVTSAFLLRR